MYLKLPKDPSLTHLKREAKSLRKTQRSGDIGVEAIVRKLHHRFTNLSPEAYKEERFSINDAMFVLARQYGFKDWTELKRKVEGRGGLDQKGLLAAFKKAVQRDSVEQVQRLAKGYPRELKEIINEPIFDYYAPATVYCVLSSQNVSGMLDALLEAGGDLNAYSVNPHGGCNGLYYALWAQELYSNPIPLEVLLRKNARIDPWTAVGLNRLDLVRLFLNVAPERIHQRGPNGCTLLHFARTVEAVDLLLERGAEVDAKCRRYLCTPAQYAVSHPEVLKRLLEKGAKPDLMMACRLDDVALAERLIKKTPDELQRFIGNAAEIYHFSSKGKSFVGIAREHGSLELVELLNRHMSLELQLIAACLEGDDQRIDEIVNSNVDSSEYIGVYFRDELFSFVNFFSDFEVFKRFMRCGIDGSFRNRIGAPLAAVVCWVGKEVELNYLLDLGIDVEMTGPSLDMECSLPHRNSPSSGRSLLDYAILATKHADKKFYQGAVQCVRLLLEAGASIQDDFIDYAPREVSKLLLEHKEARAKGASES